MSESSSCTNGCVNNNVEKEWNVIIDPEGIPIPLTERGESLEKLLDHPYVRSLIQRVGSLHYELSCKDKLVNILGYVIYNYSDKLQIIFPENKVYGPRFTSAQIATVFELAGKYKENPEALLGAFDRNNNINDISKVYGSSKVQSA